MALCDVIDRALRAFLTWHGSEFSNGAPVSSRAERTVSLASILRTSLRRARRLMPLAERLRGKEHSELSIADREAVLEGFYAVRNCYFTLIAELPLSVQPDVKLSADAGVPPVHP